MIQFSEAFQAWQPLPIWVRFLLSFGCRWPRANPKPRRIALISMPCDSPAAGLVALGAMVHDFGDPQANDVDGHYEKLLNYARQFLTHCEPCNLKCRPAVKRCGYAKEATGKLKSTHLPHNTVVISRLTDFEKRQIKWNQRDGRHNNVLVSPTPQHARNYHIDGEPACQWNDAIGELPQWPYQNLLDEVTIIPENLRRSFSGLCFAGRITGEKASKEICESVRFTDGNSTWSLRQLLAIQDWSDSQISRVAYFNSRTQKLDRNTATPSLVVADGDVAFLRACDHPAFHSCDIIGVIHRTMEYDRLEAVGIKLQPSLWFAPDTDMLFALPLNPKGISVAVLKARHFP